MERFFAHEREEEEEEERKKFIGMAWKGSLPMKEKKKKKERSLLGWHGKVPWP